MVCERKARSAATRKANAAAAAVSKGQGSTKRRGSSATTSAAAGAASSSSSSSNPTPAPSPTPSPSSTPSYKVEPGAAARHHRRVPPSFAVLYPHLLPTLHAEKQAMALEVDRYRTVGSMLRLFQAEEAHLLAGDAAHVYECLAAAMRGASRPERRDDHLKLLHTCFPTSQHLDLVATVARWAPYQWASLPYVGPSRAGSSPDHNRPAWSDPMAWMGVPGPVSTVYARTGHDTLSEATGVHSFSITLMQLRSAESNVGGSYWTQHKQEAAHIVSPSLAARGIHLPNDTAVIPSSSSSASAVAGWSMIKGGDLAFKTAAPAAPASASSSAAPTISSFATDWLVSLPVMPVPVVLPLEVTAAEAVAHAVLANVYQRQQPAGNCDSGTIEVAVDGAAGGSGSGAGVGSKKKAGKAKGKSGAAASSASTSSASAASSSAGSLVAPPLALPPHPSALPFPSTGPAPYGWRMPTAMPSFDVNEAYADWITAQLKQITTDAASNIVERILIALATQQGRPTIAALKASNPSKPYVDPLLMAESKGASLARTNAVPTGVITRGLTFPAVRDKSGRHGGTVCGSPDPTTDVYPVRPRLGFAGKILGFESADGLDLRGNHCGMVLDILYSRLHDPHGVPARTGDMGNIRMAHQALAIMQALGMLPRDVDGDVCRADDGVMTPPAAAPMQQPKDQRAPGAASAPSADAVATTAAGSASTPASTPARLSDEVLSRYYQQAAIGHGEACMPPCGFVIDQHGKQINLAVSAGSELQTTRFTAVDDPYSVRLAPGQSINKARPHPSPYSSRHHPPQLPFIVGEDKTHADGPLTRVLTRIYDLSPQLLAGFEAIVRALPLPVGTIDAATDSACGINFGRNWTVVDQQLAGATGAAAAAGGDSAAAAPPPSLPLTQSSYLSMPIGRVVGDLAPISVRDMAMRNAIAGQRYGLRPPLLLEYRAAVGRSISICAGAAVIARDGLDWANTKTAVLVDRAITDDHATHQTKLARTDAAAAAVASAASRVSPGRLGGAVTDVDRMAVDDGGADTGPATRGLPSKAKAGKRSAGKTAAVTAASGSTASTAIASPSAFFELHSCLGADVPRYTLVNVSAITRSMLLCRPTHLDRDVARGDVPSPEAEPLLHTFVVDAAGEKRVFPAGYRIRSNGMAYEGVVDAYLEAEETAVTDAALRAQEEKWAAAIGATTPKATLSKPGVPPSSPRHHPALRSLHGYIVCDGREVQLTSLTASKYIELQWTQAARHYKSWVARVTSGGSQAAMVEVMCKKRLAWLLDKLESEDSNRAFVATNANVVFTTPQRATAGAASSASSPQAAAASSTAAGTAAPPSSPLPRRPYSAYRAAQMSGLMFTGLPASSSSATTATPPRAPGSSPSSAAARDSDDMVVDEDQAPVVISHGPGGECGCAFCVIETKSAVWHADEMAQPMADDDDDDDGMVDVDGEPSAAAGHHSERKPGDGTRDGVVFDKTATAMVLDPTGANLPPEYRLVTINGKQYDLFDRTLFKEYKDDRDLTTHTLCKLNLTRIDPRLLSPIITGYYTKAKGFGTGRSDVPLGYSVRIVQTWVPQGALAILPAPCVYEPLIGVGDHDDRVPTAAAGVHHQQRRSANGLSGWLGWAHPVHLNPLAYQGLGRHIGKGGDRGLAIHDGYADTKGAVRVTGPGHLVISDAARAEMESLMVAMSGVDWELHREGLNGGGGDEGTGSDEDAVSAAAKSNGKKQKPSASSAAASSTSSASKPALDPDAVKQYSRIARLAKREAALIAEGAKSLDIDTKGLVPAGSATSKPVSGLSLREQEAVVEAAAAFGAGNAAVFPATRLDAIVRPVHIGAPSVPGKSDKTAATPVSSDTATSAASSTSTSAARAPRRPATTIIPGATALIPSDSTIHVMGNMHEGGARDWRVERLNKIRYIQGQRDHVAQALKHDDVQKMKINDERRLWLFDTLETRRAKSMDRTDKAAMARARRRQQRGVAAGETVLALASSAAEVALLDAMDLDASGAATSTTKPASSSPAQATSSAPTTADDLARRRSRSEGSRVWTCTLTKKVKVLAGAANTPGQALSGAVIDSISMDAALAASATIQAVSSSVTGAGAPTAATFDAAAMRKRITKIITSRFRFEAPLGAYDLLPEPSPEAATPGRSASSSTAPADRRRAEVQTWVSISKGITCRRVLTIDECRGKGLRHLMREADYHIPTLPDAVSGTARRWDLEYLAYNGQHEVLTDVDPRQLAAYQEFGIWAGDAAAIRPAHSIHAVKGLLNCEDQYPLSITQGELKASLYRTPGWVRMQQVEQEKQRLEQLKQSGKAALPGTRSERAVAAAAAAGVAITPKIEDCIPLTLIPILGRSILIRNTTQSSIHRLTLLLLGLSEHEPAGVRMANMARVAAMISESPTEMGQFSETGRRIEYMFPMSSVRSYATGWAPALALPKSDTGSLDSVRGLDAAAAPPAVSTPARIPSAPSAVRAVLNIDFKADPAWSCVKKKQQLLDIRKAELQTRQRAFIEKAAASSSTTVTGGSAAPVALSLANLSNENLRNWQAMMITDDTAGILNRHGGLNSKVALRINASVTRLLEKWIKRRRMRQKQEREETAAVEARRRDAATVDEEKLKKAKGTYITTAGGVPVHVPSRTLLNDDWRNTPASQLMVRTSNLNLSDGDSNGGDNERRASDQEVDDAGSESGSDSSSSNSDDDDNERASAAAGASAAGAATASRRSSRAAAAVATARSRSQLKRERKDSDHEDDDDDGDDEDVKMADGTGGSKRSAAPTLKRPGTKPPAATASAGVSSRAGRAQAEVSGSDSDDDDVDQDEVLEELRRQRRRLKSSNAEASAKATRAAGGRASGRRRVRFSGAGDGGSENDVSIVGDVNDDGDSDAGRRVESGETEDSESSSSSSSSESESEPDDQSRSSQIRSGAAAPSTGQTKPGLRSSSNDDDGHHQQERRGVCTEHSHACGCDGPAVQPQPLKQQASKGATAKSSSNKKQPSSSAALASAHASALASSSSSHHTDDHQQLLSATGRPKRRSTIGVSYDINKAFAGIDEVEDNDSKAAAEKKAKASRKRKDDSDDDDSDDSGGDGGDDDDDFSGGGSGSESDEDDDEDDFADLIDSDEASSIEPEDDDGSNDGDDEEEEGGYRRGKGALRGEDFGNECTRMELEAGMEEVSAEVARMKKQKQRAGGKKRPAAGKKANSSGASAKPRAARPSSSAASSGAVAGATGGRRMTDAAYLAQFNCKPWHCRKETCDENNDGFCFAPDGDNDAMRAAGKAHYDKHHREDDEADAACYGTRGFLVCGYCGTRSSKADNLKTHVIEAHFPEQHHECKHGCGKRFGQAANLSRHESSACPNMREEDKVTFPCGWEGCGRVFTDRANMKAHVKRDHEGAAKTFKCPQCTQAFGRLEHVQRHIDNVHEKKRWPCPLEGEDGCTRGKLHPFTVAGKLGAHLKKHHGCTPAEASEHGKNCKTFYDQS